MFTGVMVIVILFGSLVYAIEAGHEDQANFVSIPEAMWFVFVTITTVGYGDMSPVTLIGRMVVVITMYIGIVFMSIVVIIIGGNFELAQDQHIEEKKDHQRKIDALMAKEAKRAQERGEEPRTLVKSTRDLFGRGMWTQRVKKPEDPIPDMELAGDPATDNKMNKREKLNLG